MLSKIKGAFVRYLFRKFDAYFEQVFSSENRWGVVIDRTSSFEIPFQIDGGSYIEIGKSSSIGKHAWLGAFISYLEGDKFSPLIKIGDNVRIGNHACITSINRIVIGDGTLISEYFYASDHSHGISPEVGVPPISQPLFSREGVDIGHNCFIGYRVTILPGVKLGKNCVVGSHSVVTKSFPDYSMIAGVPARLIKTYNFDSHTWVSIN